MRKLSYVLIALSLILSLFQVPEGALANTKYKDISSSHWAAKDIEYLSNKGVIGGFKDGTFKPNANVTKAQASIMISRALAFNTKNMPNPGFSDVGTNSTAYQYIASMVQQGYFSKTPRFYPDDALIRFEMARIVADAFNLSGDKTSRFSDVNSTNKYYLAVDSLSYNNITVGFPDGTFKGNEPLTRAQFSVFLARAMKTGTPDKQVTKTAPVPGIDITFNMTYQQVKNRETRNLTYDYYDPSLYSFLEYDAEKYGVESKLVYSFDYGKLNSIWYDFNPENNYGTVNDLNDIYYSLQSLMENEYGSNYYYIEPDYTYLIDSSSLWTLGNYQVLLSVTNMSGDTDISISYHPISYYGASISEGEKDKVIEDLIKQVEKYENRLNK